MDRLLRRGHGPAVYGYGWSWFRRCLDAADAADKEAADVQRVRERLRRVQALGDMRMALYGEKAAVEGYIQKIEREEGSG